MPRTCTLCASPKRREIDVALATGTLSYRNISERYGTSPAALSRHKTHAAQAIVKVAEKREESISQSVLSRLEKLYGRAEKILDDAEKSKDGRLALAGIREVRETLGGIYALVSKAAGAGVEPFVIEVRDLGGKLQHG